VIENLAIIPILLFSVIIHEIAHGWSALHLGDPTARDMGRLTLNPIPHIDLFGSILLPLMSIATAGTVFIAWAKPVPINPGNFSRPRRDDMIVSFAGPASNLVLALVCSGAFLGVAAMARQVDATEMPLFAAALVFLLKMFYGGVYLNIILAVFNLIPIPPLDGSHILASFLPQNAARAYRRIGFLGIIVILFLMQVPAVAHGFRVAVAFLVSPLESLMGISL
jgi:Zn-dependent protease